MGEAEPRRFEDVRQTVADDWRRQKNAETKKVYLARLREKYGVLIKAQAVAVSDGARKRQAAIEICCNCGSSKNRTRLRSEELRPDDFARIKGFI
jgi:hypothetical protein